jgi:Metallo-beta-lactamase superfamily
MNKQIWIVLAALLSASCARTSPEMTAVNDAAEALGGKSRIQQIKTLTIDGEGEAPNLGQNITPDGPLPVWKVTEFHRVLDLATGRTRVRQARMAQFLFAGATTQKLDQGIDGEIGYNIGEDGMPSRTAESVVRDRRIESLHHPIVLLRAALDPAAKIGHLRQFNDSEQVDITTAAGDLLTLTIDAVSKTPLRISSTSYNPNLGDVSIETSFGDYDMLSGLRLPKRLITKIDKYPQFDLRITRNTLDGDTGDLMAPPQLKGMSIPPAAAITVTAKEVGKGIWWLAGSGNHRSILFEFSDHLVLFEAPLNEARTKAVIDTARSLRPEKPLTHVIVSHHHFDHSGGLRAAVAEGLTVITYRGNVEFFKDLVARKHSIVQDALARNPKPLKIEPVEDELTLKDNFMEVRLYHLKQNPREGTNLFAYVPRDRMLVQADMYDSGWLQHPWGDNLPYNMGLRKLQVALDVPVHGEIQTYDEVLKTIASRKSSD